MKEQKHAETARNARALIDPDDPPRSFFVGVTYENGSDFGFGVNKASVDSGEGSVDIIETLATHLNVAAQSMGEDRKEIAAFALQMARKQEEL